MAYVKYLLLLSLLVLGLTLLSGAAFAQDSWAVAGTGQDVPNGLVWDESASATVTATNNGTTIWDDTYGLASTAGATTQAEVDRWGVTRVPVAGTVDPATDYAFTFDVKAPPISTVAYPLPVGVSPGVIAGFDNNYVVFNGGGLINTDASINSTKITRFSDIHTGDGPHVNYAFYIEELAGRVPVITTGYADGTFLPVNKVNRGQMAAFMQRSLELPLGTYQGLFSDVPETYGFALQIEACVDGDVVQGFGDGTYKPTTNVNRRQMAVFLARGLTGGDAFIPSYLASDQTFPDVAVGDFGFNAIEFCVDQGITTGFPDGTYGPLNNVTRGQMATFVYRSFIEPTDSVVVLAGPAFTEVDPATAGYDGWPSVSLIASGTGTANAYVAFDAVRFGATQPDFDVDFALYNAADIGADGLPIGAAVPAVQQTVTVGVAAARTAAYASGNPYTYATWAVSGLADGQYKLLTTVNGTLLTREPSLVVGTSGLIAGAFDPAAVAAATWDVSSGRVISAGSNADLLAADGTYLVTKRDRQPNWADADGGDWCSNGNHATGLIWYGVPKDAATLELTIKYHANNPNDGTWGGAPPGDPDCCATSCCGDWGELDYWDLPTAHPAAYSFNNTPENSPLGWGLMVETGAFDAGPDWWDTTGDGGDPEIFTLDGSGTPASPSARDITGGGDMFPTQGFTGFARDTDVTVHWGTTNVAGFVNANGDFVATFCGGSIYELHIDQAVIEYTK